MQMKSVGTYIIASAVVWAGIIIGCSLKLKGTGCYDEISTILSMGFIAHLLFIWGPLVVQVKKLKKEN